MTKSTLFIFAFLFGLSGCSRKPESSQSIESGASQREVPFPAYNAGSPEDRIKFKPVGGTTDYVLVEGVTPADYSKLQKKAVRDGVNYMAMEPIPRHEVFRVQETSGPFKIAKYRLDDESHVTMEVPKEWDTNKESGSCDMDCDPAFDAISIYPPEKKGKPVFETAIADFSSEETYNFYLNRDHKFSKQNQQQWHKENVHLEDVGAKLVVFKADDIKEPSSFLIMGFDLNPNEQTLIFRLTPQLPDQRIIVYVALHGNNPSKKDWNLARQVALSFRYHQKPLTQARQTGNWRR